MPESNTLDHDPLWYKDAIIYGVHVRAFLDHSGDGMGDFAGLTQRLDHLQELVAARLHAADGRTGVLYSALRNREFAEELFGGILRRRRFAGERGEIAASHTRAFRGLWEAGRADLRSRPWPKPTRTTPRCFMATAWL